jgi:hypothetical protein
MTGFALDPRNLTPAEIEAVARSAVPDLSSSPAPAESPDVMSAAARKRAAADYRYIQEHLEFARDCELADSTKFGEVIRNDAGETLSYASLAPAALAAQEQLELELPRCSKNVAIREEFADRIEHRLIPYYRANGLPWHWCQSHPERLRSARKEGFQLLDLDTGKRTMCWKRKAGLARVCPDDAREESARMVRRYLPAILEAQKKGYTIYNGVLTSPNAAPGGLRKEMHAIFRKFRRLTKAKYPDGSKRFHEIKGTLLVQEAPLGRSGDWNVHLNVILIVDGYLNFGKLRNWWHWNLHLNKLPEGHIALRGALAELIKYAATAVVSKSHRKAAQHAQALTSSREARSEKPFEADGYNGGYATGISRAAAQGGASLQTDQGTAGAAHDTPSRADQEAAGCPAGSRTEGSRVRGDQCADVPPEVFGADRRDEHRPVAPGMFDWSDERLAEWYLAHKGFRRSRSCGCLFRVKKPLPEPRGRQIAIATIGWHEGAYRYEFPLLRSIPEDKSPGRSGAERWLALVRALNPAGIEGAGTLGEQISRDALHSSLEQLQKM